MAATLAGALKRRLLASGCTAHPYCKACQTEVPVGQWGTGATCRRCEVALHALELACAKAALHDVEERLHEVWCASREATDPITAERLDREQQDLESERRELTLLLERGPR